MKFLVYMDRINQLHKLVKLRRTGSPEHLSRKMGISYSRLFRIIDELKLNGAPIAYSRKDQTYYYEDDFEILLSAKFMLLAKEESLIIQGGQHQFFGECLESQCYDSLGKDRSSIFLQTEPHL